MLRLILAVLLPIVAVALMARLLTISAGFRVIALVALVLFCVALWWGLEGRHLYFRVPPSEQPVSP